MSISLLNKNLARMICCLTAAVVILVITAGGLKAAVSASGIPGTGCSSSEEAATQPENWMLILVNGSHPVPDGYEIEFTELSNGQKVDKRIYPELQQMFDDARAEGLGLTVREGYRTHREQEDMMKQKIREYRDQGYSAAESKRRAAELVAAPGTSEHELGMAVDINPVGETDQWELYGWLADNSWKYGFILRYPLNKEDITGITYEPWHYRYVGKEAAREIYDRQITLEEYLGY